MNRNCNVVESSLAYNTEHRHGSAQVKAVSLGFFKKALRQAGYTAASSSLNDDRATTELRVIYVSIPVLLVFFSHRLQCHAGMHLCRWLCTAHTPWDSPVLTTGIKRVSFTVSALPSVFLGQYSPYDSVNLSWILKSKILLTHKVKFRRPEVCLGKGHILYTHSKVFTEHLTEWGKKKKKREHLIMPFHLALSSESSPKIKRELMNTIKSVKKTTQASRFLNDFCKRWATWHWSHSSSQIPFPSKFLLARWSRKLKGKLLKCLERLSVLS